MRIAFAIASALFLASCQQGHVLSPALPGPGFELAPPERAWVAIEPIQCLGNPWEQDWLASHHGDYGSYPRDNPFQIIKDYYRRQGVVVYEAATQARYEVVCLACSCPEGYTLYLEVRRQDVPAMLALGYREESPG